MSFLKESVLYRNERLFYKNWSGEDMFGVPWRKSEMQWIHTMFIFTLLNGVDCFKVLTFDHHRFRNM